MTALAEQDVVPLLERCELEILGLLPRSSNYTFLARATDVDDPLVVYKPRAGEAPLWDFPDGTLCQREVAAYLDTLHLPRGSVVVDAFSGFAVIAHSADPAQFVITPDEDIHRAIIRYARAVRATWLTDIHLNFMKPLALRAFGRIAADLVLQMRKVDELIRLPAQFVGHHRRIGGERRDHADPPGTAGRARTGRFLPGGRV